MNDTGIQPAVANPAPPPASDIDYELLYQRAIALQERYSGREKNDEAVDKLYSLITEEPEEGTVETVITSKPFDAVNMATDMLTTNMPQWEVVAIDDTEAAREVANMAERFLQGVWYEAERHSAKPLAQSLAHNGFLYGRFAARVLERKTQSKTELPFRIQVRDPRTVYPDYDEDGHLNAVAEVFERKLSDVRRSWPDWDPPAKEYGDNWKEDDDVQWVEYWDAEYFAYFCNAKKVECGRHNLGRIPYVCRFGRFRPDASPANWGLSLLAGLRYVIPQYNAMLSAKATAIRQYVQGVIIRYSDHSDSQELDLTPGAQNQAWSDEKYEWFRPQGVMPEMEQMLTLMRDELRDATFSSLTGQQSFASGYAMSQASRSEKNKINPVKVNLEWALGELAQLILLIAEKHGKPITVSPPQSALPSALRRRVTMTPEVARDHQTVFCIIPPDYLEDKVQQMSLAIQATSGPNPILDRETALRDILRVPDPQQVEENVMRQKLIELVWPRWQEHVARRGGWIAEQPLAQSGQSGGPPGQGMPALDGPQAPQQLLNAQQQTNAAAGIPPRMEQDLMSGVVRDVIGQGTGVNETMQRLIGLGTPQAGGGL